MTMQVRAQRVIYKDSIDVAIFHKHWEGTKSIALPLTMKVLEPNARIEEPTFSLTNDEAQFMMDELWNCGLRPTEGSGSAGSLAATERHLKDMQTIAFGLLRKDSAQV